MAVRPLEFSGSRHKPACPACRRQAKAGIRIQTDPLPSKARPYRPLAHPIYETLRNAEVLTKCLVRRARTKAPVSPFARWAYEAAPAGTFGTTILPVRASNTKVRESESSKRHPAWLGSYRFDDATKAGNLCQTAVLYSGDAHLRVQRAELTQTIAVAKRNALATKAQGPV